jgi:hypothetical protein
MMQPRELFGVVVRTGGLVLLGFSIIDSFHAVAHLTGLPISSRFSLRQDLIAMSFYFAMGIALTRGADWIVRFAYGSKKDFSN